MSEIRYLIHGRIQLALHTLRAGKGLPLLLLHGLGEHSPSRLPPEYESWPGAVYGLDFTGHGQSTVPRGGGYTAELLQADADVALAELGPVTVVGRGLGAYVAVLIAGGRPDLVRGAILRDGTGLAGGAPGSSPYIGYPEPAHITPPDPFAMVELAIDVRPPDYVTEFVRLAAEYSDCPRPISVCACERCPWITAVVAEIGVEVSSVEEALSYYAVRNSDK